MGKINTEAAFLLAYYDAYPCDKILGIAEEINYQEAQKIMSQGLADHLGVCTEEDTEIFEIFEGDEKAPEVLESVLLGTHSRLEDMVAKDYISKLSMDEAVMMIRILRKSPHVSFMFGGVDGVIIRENYIVSRWSNTHRDEKDKFIRIIRENLS